MKDFYTLITGAGAGIGKELAIACAQRGFHLLLVSLPDDGLPGLAQSLHHQYQVKVDFFEIDLQAPNAPQTIFDWCQHQQYTVDKLINNAGIGGSRPFEYYSLPELHAMIQLNTYVSSALTHLFLPMLRELPKAHILNVSSTASFFSLPHKAVYAATKAYINTLSACLRNELTHTPVIVSVLCPGGSTHKRDAQVEQKINRFVSNIIHEQPVAIAQAGIRGMLAGKKMILPGVVAKFYVFAARLVPGWVADPVIRRLFTTSRSTSATPAWRRRLSFWSMAVAACLIILFVLLFFHA